MLEIQIISSLKNFSFEKTGINVETIGQTGHGFLISNSSEIIISNFLSDTFIMNLGKMNLDSLLDSTYAYFTEDFRDFSEQNIEVDLIEFLEQSWGPFQVFLLSLWFIKDNSVNFETAYLYAPEKEIVFGSRRNMWFCNSIGKYTQTVFTDEELEEAYKWSLMIIKHQKYTEGEMKPRVDVNNAGGIEYRNNDTYTVYSSKNRFYRALRFIQVARSESFLPVKISAYVGAIEALLSTSNKWVAHQISDRVAKIIDGGSKERSKNYKFIKKVYTVRSQYVHGSGLGKTLEALKESSKELDNIMRNLMKELFKHPEMATMNNGDLDKWFENLTLQ